MKKIVFLFVLFVTLVACKKETADYSKQIGKINPPAWMHGHWETETGAPFSKLEVSQDNIIKDDSNQKQLIEGQEVIFEDVFKYSQDQYFYIYELKEPIEITIKYDVVTSVTIYEENLSVAVDENGKPRTSSNSVEKTASYSAKFFKSYYDFQSKKTMSYTGIFVVNDALVENRNFITKNTQLSKTEKKLVEKVEDVNTGQIKDVKRTEETISKIQNIRVESIKGTTWDDFVELVTPRKYKKI